MTPERRAELVEKVARNTYERCKARFAEDPVNEGWGDFVDDVFPPWEEAEQSDYLGDAEKAIDLLAPLIRAEALREVVNVADEYAKAALKCGHCGDIRHTYIPGGCAGETAYRNSYKYKERVLLDGPYEAQRYFEKHICRPEEMSTQEAFEAFAAAIRALIPSPSEPPAKP